MLSWMGLCPDGPMYMYINLLSNMRQALKDMLISIYYLLYAKPYNYREEARYKPPITCYMGPFMYNYFINKIEGEMGRIHFF